MKFWAASLFCLASATVACAQSPLDGWKANMLTYGEKYCQKGNTDQFYDAIRVYYQISQYTGNSQWERCAENEIVYYRDGYLAPNNNGPVGHWIFPHGLMMHYQRTRDEKSKEAILGMARNAAFAYAPLEWTANANGSREVAFNLEAKLIASELGYKDEKRIKQLADQALDHYNQWFVSRTASYVQPFMAGLTAEALIMWYDKTKDPRVLPALKTGADWMWEHMWLPKQRAFKYTDRKIASGDESPAPDLNLLVAPLYAWIYKMSGEPKYRTMADKIFEGGVDAAYLVSPKHFNQNYRWSFDYLRWREGPGK